MGIGPNSGTAGEDIIVYGAQLETGTTATSYIPTTGSPATRTADSAVITDLSGWMRTDQGTFVVSHDADAGRVLLSSGANELLESQGAGTIAVAYDASGSSVSYNGGAAVAGPALSFDTALRLFASASEVMGAHGAKVLYFPVPLTPAQLQALTS